MATVKGVWQFNDTISVSSALHQLVEWDDPEGYAIPSGRYGFKISSGVLYSLMRDGGVYDEIYSSQNGWNTSRPTRYIDFGTVEQEVSDGFYTWITANASEASMNVKRCKLTVSAPKNTWFSLKAYRHTGESKTVEMIWDDSANTFTYYLYDYAVFVGRAYNQSNSSQVYNIKVNGEAVEYSADETTAQTNPFTISGDTTIEILSTLYSTDGTGRYGFKIGGEEPTTATVITYNGDTIATLEAGQTATIKTAETEVEHDIVITPVFSIEIAYGDSIATAEAGQTATIKCANTEADFDIVVSAKEEEANYLTFSSPSSFTLKTYETKKNWNGTLEYSTDASVWNVWDGKTTLSADNGKLYLRGTGNTKVAGSGGAPCWALSGTDISCEGNIENLLDYATVANGEHPTMAENCFFYMFSSCTSLISAPELPATALTNYCYSGMFSYCTSLVNAPELPATTLANNCYQSMFSNCTSLVGAPELPAIIAPSQCYYSMFEKCTSLVNAPALPATTVTAHSYARMFADCTSLASIPALPAGNIPTYCYFQMFYNCAGIKISDTKTEEYCNEYRMPTSGEGTTTGDYALTAMFKYTGGTFKSDPSINTTYYTSNTVVY